MMRLMKKNLSKFSYLLFQSKTPVLDEYGNPTSEYTINYAEPVEISGNISPAGGAAQIEQFGSSIQYDKVILVADTKCPIDENTVLFVDRSVAYNADNLPLYDYVVKKVAKSLNHVAYAISKVNIS